MAFQDVFRSLEETIAQQVRQSASELHDVWAADQEKKLTAVEERLRQLLDADRLSIRTEIAQGISEKFEAGRGGETGDEIQVAAASVAASASSVCGNVVALTSALRRQVSPSVPPTPPDVKPIAPIEGGAIAVSLGTSGGLKLPVERRGGADLETSSPLSRTGSKDSADGRGERREPALSRATVTGRLLSSPAAAADESVSKPGVLSRSRTSPAFKSSVRFQEDALPPVLSGQNTPPRSRFRSQSSFLRRSRTSVTSVMPEVEEDQDWDLPSTTGHGIRSQLHNKTLWKMFAALLVVIAGFVAALYVYPFFTLAALLCITMWVFYLFAEEPLIIIMSKWNMKWLVQALRYGQSMRAKHEMELRVQSWLTSACIGILALNPDIGLLRYLFRTLSLYAALPLLLSVMLGVVYVSGSIVHMFHDRSARAVRWNVSRRRMSSGADSPRGGSAEVVEILETMKKGLQETRTRQRRKIEKDIYETVEHTDSRILNELLVRMSKSQDCSLLKLLKHCRDTPERASRRELIELLCVDRAHDLSVRAKSAVLNALMSLHEVAGSEAMQLAVEKLLCSVKGDDLSDLKSMQDGGGDINSMHKLLFQDLTQPDNLAQPGSRNRLLDHFLGEGLAQVAHRELMSSDHFMEMLRQGVTRECVPSSLDLVKGSAVEEFGAFGDLTPGGTRARFSSFSSGGSSTPRYDGEAATHTWVKIVFDIDDTFQSSGAAWPAGIDGRYNKHTTYPGVLAFFRELQSGGGSLPSGVTSQLVALSARPHIPGDYMEQKVFSRFRLLMDNNCLHAMPALLTGSLDTSWEFLGGDLAALGRKKLQGFEQYMALYPEFRFIFVGDNGQADYAVGQMMCRKFPYSVEQVWIHEVQPRTDTWAYEPDSEAPVCFFSDYIAAAVVAAVRPKALVTPEGLVRVANAAVSDFHRIVQEGGIVQANREPEASRLNASIERAREALRDLGSPHLCDDLVSIEIAAEAPKAEAPRSSIRFSFHTNAAKPTEEVQAQEAVEVQDDDESPITAALNAEQHESLREFPGASSFMSLPGAGSDEDPDEGID